MFDEVKMKIFKKKSRGSRKGPRFSRYRGSIMFISCILLVLAAVTTVHSISLGAQLRDKTAQISDLEKEKEEQRTEEIEKYKDYVGTDEYVEDTARDRLGMVKENEILFKAEE